MQAPQTIVCAIDFSPESEHAAQYAADLAGAWGAQLLLLHVLEDAAYAHSPLAEQSPVASASLARSAEAHRAEAERDLASLAARLQARPTASGAALRVGTRIGEGVPYAVVVETAERLGADAIVIGTRPRSRLSRALLGSVAERVVRLASCPVFTIPMALGG
ncbi:MAG: universal stress protein [Myxococcales bacterium]|jgi:nucleotide-binding universal stress UspA family protein